MYGVEVILTTTTTHARNHASADLDSYLVDVLEREGIHVLSVLSRRKTKSTWTKSPHNIEKQNQEKTDNDY
tara:strand:- start:989 stop:1201 length:213 start_codon:yes stop_codon:yes gene_type:complete